MNNSFNITIFMFDTACQSIHSKEKLTLSIIFYILCFTIFNGIFYISTVHVVFSIAVLWKVMLLIHHTVVINTMVYIITVLVQYPTLWKACWFGWHTPHTRVQSLLMERCDQVPLINTTQIVLIKNLYWFVRE